MFSLLIFFGRNRINPVLSSIMHYFQLVKNERNLKFYLLSAFFVDNLNLETFLGFIFATKHISATDFHRFG